MNPRTVCLLVCFLAVAAVSASAQDLMFVDSQGNRVLVDSKNPGRFATPPTPTKVLKAGNLTFNVTYQDVVINSNAGFDDPVEGGTRQACVDAVLAYINTVLNENTGATIDILFEPSLNSGTSFLATAGTLWFTSPARFDNGFAFEHITTGIDPTGSSVDIECTVNFGYNWNSNPAVPATPSQVDLFSVLLHEMTHGLGILSLSDNNGLGLVGTNPDVYAEWDRLMQLGASSPCWHSTTTALLVAPTAFTSDNLFFSGSEATAAFGSRPPIYAPNPFESGSSLAHFKTGTVSSVMEHAISFGETRHEYEPVDIAALVDIGYTNAASADAPVANFSADDTSGDAPLAVIFTDTSTNSPTSWAWDFDNNGSTDSTLQNPSHVYSAPGVYTVKLTATNANGSDDEVKTNYITVTVLQTTIDVTGGGWAEVGDDVTFTAGPAGAVGYQWYKDGEPLSGEVNSTFNLVSVVLADSGEYYCEVTTASKGIANTPTVTLTVFPVGTLPAGTLAGIVALLTALAAVATAFVRRTRRPV